MSKELMFIKISFYTNISLFKTIIKIIMPIKDKDKSGKIMYISCNLI